MEEKNKKTTKKKTTNTKGTSKKNIKKTDEKVKINEVKESKKIEENVKKRENKTLNKIKEFFNKPAPIIITLIIIVIFLLFYIHENLVSSAVYVGTVDEDDIQIVNIHYFVNNDMNYFYASTALYTGDDIDVYNYQIGYYVVDDDGNYIEFVTRSKEADTAASLSDIVEELSAWSVGEANISDYYFNKDVIANIDNLHFVVKASTESGSNEADVYIDYQVALQKITKN